MISGQFCSSEVNELIDTESPTPALRDNLPNPGVVEKGDSMVISYIASPCFRKEPLGDDHIPVRPCPTTLMLRYNKQITRLGGIGVAAFIRDTLECPVPYRMPVGRKKKFCLNRQYGSPISIYHTCSSGTNPSSLNGKQPIIR